MTAKSVRPCRVRQAPLEVRCWILTGWTSLSAWLFVQGTARSTWREAQDDVFVVAEAPGQPQRVGGQWSGAGAVGGDAQFDGAAVVVADRGQCLGSRVSCPAARAACALWWASVRVAAIAAAQSWASGSAVWKAQVGVMSCTPGRDAR
jgi:hypothetical protein